MTRKLTFAERIRKTVGYGVSGGAITSASSLAANLLLWWQRLPADKPQSPEQMLFPLYVMSIVGGTVGSVGAATIYRGNSVSEFTLTALLGAAAGAVTADFISFISNLMCNAALGNTSSSSSSDYFAGNTGSFATCAQYPALMFGLMGASIFAIGANKDLFCEGASSMWKRCKKLAGYGTAATDTETPLVAVNAAEQNESTKPSLLS